MSAGTQWRYDPSVLEQIDVGQVDDMSRSAYRNGLPICGRIHPRKRTLTCTRAAGHDESNNKHPGSTHVHAPGPSYVVKAVWS